MTPEHYGRKQELFELQAREKKVNIDKEEGKNTVYLEY